jgi:Mce-associated membrane protein
LSFDYRHLDDNAKAARPLLSGAYRQDYDKSMSEHAAAWKKYHYVVKSTVASAGVSQMSGSQVVVVAFVDQSVSAGTTKIGTAKDLIRLRFTVQHRGGSWLLTKLDSL